MKLIFFYFILSSIAGWILETVFRSVKNRKIINPGFNKGFYLPIYGWGALIILAVHQNLSSVSPISRLIIYFVALSVLEYLAGYFVEKIFRIKLWDYRGSFLNIKGHVSLLFSCIWGILASLSDYSLVILKPVFTDFYYMNQKLSDIIFTIVAVVMILDSAVSLYLRFKRRSGNLSKKDNERKFRYYSSSIINHPNFVRLEKVEHHNGKSRIDHVKEVAWISFLISDFFSLDSKAVVRGALLHDLFYYNWQRDSPRLHAFKHPGIALRNACKITHLSRKEEDIIKKHMWPLTLIPPFYPESFLVSFIDTYCSIKDYLCIKKHPNTRGKSFIKKLSEGRLVK